VRALAVHFDFLSSPVLITAQMSSAFCKVTGDIEQFHLHPARAKDSFFRTRIASGPLTTSLSIRSMWEMHERKGIFPNHEVVSLYCDSRFLKPIEVGTRIRFKWTLLSSTEKALAGQLATVCDWKVEVFDSNGELAALQAWKFGYVLKRGRRPRLSSRRR
jgi:acyl dehydratase